MFKGIIRILNPWFKLMYNIVFERQNIHRKQFEGKISILLNSFILSK